MIKKPLKSNLIIDGEICRNIEQLKENFNLIDILKEFENGNLAEFCKKRVFDRVDEINEIDKSSDLKQIAFKLCEIFDIEVNEALIEKEVENYNYSLLSAEEKNLKSENSVKPKLTTSNSAIKVIKIKNLKNNLEIFPAKFKFLPIKFDSNFKDIKFHDYSNNSYTDLNSFSKDVTTFNGLLVQGNFKDEIEDENLKKAILLIEDLDEEANDEVSELKIELKNLNKVLYKMENFDSFWDEEFELCKFKNNLPYQLYSDEYYQAFENTRDFYRKNTLKDEIISNLKKLIDIQELKIKFPSSKSYKEDFDKQFSNLKLYSTYQREDYCFLNKFLLNTGLTSYYHYNCDVEYNFYNYFELRIFEKKIILDVIYSFLNIFRELNGFQTFYIHFLRNLPHNGYSVNNIFNINELNVDNICDVINDESFNYYYYYSITFYMNYKLSLIDMYLTNFIKNLDDKDLSNKILKKIKPIKYWFSNHSEYIYNYIIENHLEKNEKIDELQNIKIYSNGDYHDRQRETFFKKYYLFPLANFLKNIKKDKVANLVLIDIYGEIENYKNENWELVK